MVMNEVEYIKKLETTFEKNKNIRFKRYELLYDFGNYNYRYAFGTNDNSDNFYGVPVCAGNVMKYNIKTGNISFLQGVSDNNFEYTWGIFDEARKCVWGVPRNSNKLLKINVENYIVEEIPLGLNYHSNGINESHHYSGVLFKDHIYSPPRANAKGLLKISLDTFDSAEIPIVDPKNGNSLYSGSVLHPNGNIYLLPSSGGRTAVFNVEAEEVTFIGDRSDCLNFGGVIWKDGNIYCFVKTGVVKIDVHTNNVELVYKYQSPKSAYGTMLHSNGKLYSSIIQETGEIIEYDPAENIARPVAIFHDQRLPACTAGVEMSDGNIYTTPCRGKYFIRYVFE